MFLINFEAFKKKICSKVSKVRYINKTFNVITHFVIIIVTYLALIRLPFVFRARFSPNQKKIHTTLLLLYY